MGGAPLQPVSGVQSRRAGGRGRSCYNATYAVQQGFGSYFGLN